MSLNYVDSVAEVLSFTGEKDGVLFLGPNRHLLRSKLIINHRRPVTETWSGVGCRPGC